MHDTAATILQVACQHQHLPSFACMGTILSNYVFGVGQALYDLTLVTSLKNTMSRSSGGGVSNGGLPISGHLSRFVVHVFEVSFLRGGGGGRIFPILGSSLDFSGIVPTYPLPLAVPILQGPTRNIPERVRDTMGPSRKNG